MQTEKPEALASLDPMQAEEPEALATCCQMQAEKLTALATPCPLQLCQCLKTKNCNSLGSSTRHNVIRGLAYTILACTGDGSSGPSASQAELLLRVLELVKQLQPEHPYEDSPPTSPSPALMKGHPAPPDSLYPTPSAVYASRPQTAPAPTHGAVHRDRIPEGWRTHANISRSNDVGAWQQVPQPYAQEPLAHLDTPKQAKQARPAEREMEQAQDVPAPPPPGSKITLNPRNRGEVSVVVPVMYSLMGSHERRKYADWQLSRPPNHGPAHELTGSQPLCAISSLAFPRKLDQRNRQGPGSTARAPQARSAPRAPCFAEADGCAGPVQPTLRYLMALSFSLVAP
eukprot:scaffold121557_cov19-Tisochrysis_lutea.AAC.4